MFETGRSPRSILFENVVPLAGVLFLGWSIAPVMVIYWIENGFHGLFLFARMVTKDGVRVPLRELAPRLISSLFILVHYGIFWAVHGVFVFGLFVNRELERGFGARPEPLPTGQILLAALVIAVSLGVSFFRGAERSPDGSGLGGLLARTYGRMIVLHVSLILGGLGIVIFGSPIFAVILLIVLKTVAEIATEPGGVAWLSARARRLTSSFNERADTTTDPRDFPARPDGIDKSASAASHHDAQDTIID